MEDAEKHTEFVLVSTPKRFQKGVNSPAYIKHINNENLVGVGKEKAAVDLNTSIYMGLSFWISRKFILLGPTTISWNQNIKTAS